MTTCGYAHVVLSGFLSSKGVIALILLKLVDRPKDEDFVG